MKPVPLAEQLKKEEYVFVVYEDKPRSSALRHSWPRTLMPSPKKNREELLEGLGLLFKPLKPVQIDFPRASQSPIAPSKCPRKRLMESELEILDEDFDELQHCVVRKLDVIEPGAHQVAPPFHLNQVIFVKNVAHEQSANPECQFPIKALVVAGFLGLQVGKLEPRVENLQENVVGSLNELPCFNLKALHALQKGKEEVFFLVQNDIFSQVSLPQFVAVEALVVVIQRWVFCVFIEQKSPVELREAEREVKGEVDLLD